MRPLLTAAIKPPLTAADVAEIRRRHALYLANSPKRIATDFRKSVRRIHHVICSTTRTETPRHAG